MAEIKNYTDMLAAAEAFLRAKIALIDTQGLSIHIKHQRRRRRDITGYYRFADRRIVLAVKKRLRYPRNAAYGVGSARLIRPTAKGRPYKLVWHEECFESPDQLLVFVAGHEIWHFLCHSGQRRGDHETKANCNGFLWLAEFKRWGGPGHAVAPIPPLPPRPDLPAAMDAGQAQPPAAAPRSTIPAPIRKDSARDTVDANGDAAHRRPPRHDAWEQGELFSADAADRAAAPPPRPSPPRRGRRRENG